MSETERRRTPPVDPRLWRYARAGRGLLASVVVFGIASAALTVVFAAAAATAGATILADPAAATITAQWKLILIAGAALAGRALLTYLSSRIEQRSAERVVSELRGGALNAIGAGRIPGDVELLRTALTRGLDQLPPYLTGYLPALGLSMTATPLLIVAIAAADPLSAVIVIATLPLLPIFMVLVGLLTQDRTRRRLDAMSRLSAQLLDLVAGLPTLRALGRQHGPEHRVRELGERNARETMGALRIAFLSSMVLELLATLCVALVAVGIGLRLVFGEMGLAAGMFALILAPEVYQPLRNIGAAFHAAEAGTEATRVVFGLLDSARPTNAPPAPSVAAPSVAAPSVAAPSVAAPSVAAPSVAAPSAPAPSAGSAPPGRIDVRAVTVDGRDGPAPRAVTATLAAGALTVLTGPNGCGKSTLLQCLAGVIDPDAGAIEVDGRQLRGGPDWWDRIAWCPQRPLLMSGTLAENFTLLGAPPLDCAAGRSASAAVGFDEVLAEHGPDYRIGADGSGISAGQRQRLALARTLALGRPVLLFDEPTAHLDAELAARVAEVLSARAASGDLVVAIAHDGPLLAAANSGRTGVAGGTGAIVDLGVRSCVS